MDSTLFAPWFRSVARRCQKTPLGRNAETPWQHPHSSSPDSTILNAATPCAASSHDHSRLALHRVHPLAKVLSSGNGGGCICCVSLPRPWPEYVPHSAHCKGGKPTTDWPPRGVSSSWLLRWPTSMLRREPHNAQMRDPGGRQELARYRSARSMTLRASFPHCLPHDWGRSQSSSLLSRSESSSSSSSSSSGATMSVIWSS